MFDRYYCKKVTKQSSLGRYFDALFWHEFVFVFVYIVARRLFPLVSSFQGHLNTPDTAAR